LADRSACKASGQIPAQLSLAKCCMDSPEDWIGNAHIIGRIARGRIGGTKKAMR